MLKTKLTEQKLDNRKQQLNQKTKDKESLSKTDGGRRQHTNLTENKLDSALWSNSKALDGAGWWAQCILFISLEHFCIFERFQHTNTHTCTHRAKSANNLGSEFKLPEF